MMSLRMIRRKIVMKTLKKFIKAIKKIIDNILIIYIIKIEFK